MSPIEHFHRHDLWDRHTLIFYVSLEKGKEYDQKKLSLFLATQKDGVLLEIHSIYFLPTYGECTQLVSHSLTQYTEHYRKIHKYMVERDE